MSSLVSDLIINPVLRQARRLSEISRNSSAGDGEDAAARPGAQSQPSREQQPELEASITLESTQARPLSSSTEETRVEEANHVVPITDNSTRNQLGSSGSPSGKHRQIPEDDGMHHLRARIHIINAQQISPDDKARLMHDALQEGYKASRLASDPEEGSYLKSPPKGLSEHSVTPPRLDSLRFWQSSADGIPIPTKAGLSQLDLAPTFAPIRQSKSPPNEMSPTPPSNIAEPSSPPLGCQHYERNVKIECSACKKWYTCVFCHDEKEGHNLQRKETRHMLCMLCTTPQRASDVCINCGEMTAQYYCSICKLWENRSTKPIYHCHECGICRRGMGLGKDFFHCKTCRACITTSIESSHKCIERSTDCDCPICGDYMFTSPRPVVFMKCGHSIHKKCYDAHMKVSYKCPICSKSLANMESQFRNLDVVIQAQPMPVEFRDTQATILCNDCSARSTVAYHWLGLKCFICRSYNTVQLHLLGNRAPELESDIVERPVVSGHQGPYPGIEEVQPNPTPTRSRVHSRTTSRATSRRRHSSYGGDLQPLPPDRIVRSSSFNPGGPLGQEHHGHDSESEDDILGFWGRLREADESSSDNADDGDESSDDGHSDDVDSDNNGEEEEEEDDIVLIGHR